MLRFESSLTDPGTVCGFNDYVSRAKDGQESIYYLVGASREQIESSPYLEAFKARGLEVVYFTDAVDEYVVESLGQFDGKKLVSIRHGGVDLEDHAPEGDALSEEQTTALCSYLREELGDRVTAVAIGKRLVDSPVIALVPGWTTGISPASNRRPPSSPSSAAASAAETPCASGPAGTSQRGCIASSAFCAAQPLVAATATQPGPSSA